MAPRESFSSRSNWLFTYDPAASETQADDPAESSRLTFGDLVPLIRNAAGGAWWKMNLATETIPAGTFECRENQKYVVLKALYEPELLVWCPARPSTLVADATVKPHDLLRSDTTGPNVGASVQRAVGNREQEAWLRWVKSLSPSCLTDLTAPCISRPAPLPLVVPPEPIGWKPADSDLDSALTYLSRDLAGTMLGERHRVKPGQLVMVREGRTCKWFMVVKAEWYRDQPNISFPSWRLDGRAPQLSNMPQRNLAAHTPHEVLLIPVEYAPACRRLAP